MIRASSASSTMYYDRGERRYRVTVVRGGEVWRFYQVVRDGERWRRVHGPEIPTHRLFVNAAGARRAYEFPPSFPIDDRWRLYPDELVEGQLEAATPDRSVATRSLSSAS